MEQCVHIIQYLSQFKYLHKTNITGQPTSGTKRCIYTMAMFGFWLKKENRVKDLFLFISKCLWILSETEALFYFLSLTASSPLAMKAWLTDTSSCHMMTVTVETGATEEATGISKRPVTAGLVTPGRQGAMTQVRKTVFILNLNFSKN